MNFLVAFIGLLAQATDVKDTVAEAAAGAASAAPASGSGWITFLIVLACLILPLVIGNAIARAIRLKEYGSKIGVSLLTLVLGLTPFVSRIIQGKDWKEAFKFGIDLAGGTNMTFAVDEDRLKDTGLTKKDITPEIMGKMQAAVSKRINPSGTEEINVRVVGKDRIEVIVPGADKEQVEAIKNRITNLGSLEFDILASRKDGRHTLLIKLGEQLPQSQTAVFKPSDQEGQDPVEIGRWIPLANIDKSKTEFKSRSCSSLE